MSASSSRSNRPSASAIEVTRLSKTYPGGVEAVKGIDFTVRTGEVFGLLGPNGAGKSTTIGMLTTTVTPTDGTALVMGFDVAIEPIAARSVSAVVFQEPVVDRSLTGRRNLETHARLWGVDPSRAKSRIAEVTLAFGLGELLDRPVASYSGGERRRLEIARSLVSEPAVLFLDEPSVGLDPRIRYELLDLIATLRDTSDVTILLTTHYLDEAERLCDRVGIVHAGRRTFLGPYRDSRVRRYANAMLGDAAIGVDYLRALDNAVCTTLSDRPVLLVFGQESPTVKEGIPSAVWPGSPTPA